MRIHLCFIVSTFFFFTIHGQEIKEIELDPVTISSGLSPIASSKTGRNIITIRGEEFQKFPIHSIDELLRYLPGLEVQARGPMGTQSDFVSRGGTFQQILVVLDGMRLNDPNTGHFSSYIPLAPIEIERIELLKGASSAIYGSDAVGGVIHIITKTFNAKNKAQTKLITGQIAAGEYGLVNANAGVFYNKNKTAFAGGLLSNNASGQKGRGVNNFFHLNTISASVNHQINPQLQISFRTAYDDRKFSAQNYYTTSVADTAEERVKILWNQLHLGYQKNKNRFSLGLGYKKVEDNFRFNQASTANNNKSGLLQALGVYEHTFGTKTSFTSGIQFQNKNINSNDRGKHNVKQAAGFFVLQQLIGEKFNVSPALRLDWDERSGTEFIPQVNLSYRLTQLQIRGSAGKTIRQADFTERYNNYNRALVPALNRVGNPGLEAETSFSYEAGADFFAAKNLKLTATYFQRDHNDLIDYVATPYSAMPRKENLVPSANYFLAKNISEITTNGFETDIQFQKSFGKQQLFTNLGVVWAKSKADSATPSLYISSHARFLANFSIRYSFSKFNIGINGLYKERARAAASAIKAELTTSYFVLNAKAEFIAWNDLLSIFVEVDNITDKSYSDLLGAKMPGRWLMGGIKISLSK